MYSVGDIVVYNEDGVCRVENVGALKIASADRDQQYYTLRPVNGDGRIYVPVDTKLPMRPALSREEAMELIRQMPAVPAEVCRQNNRRLLEEHYRTLMQPHTPLSLVRTLRSVCEKRNGGDRLRALSSTDEYYRKRAEALLYQELSIALEVPAEKMEGFIAEIIEKPAG